MLFFLMNEAVLLFLLFWFQASIILLEVFVFFIYIGSTTEEYKQL